MRKTLLLGALLLATPVIAQTTVIEERSRPSTSTTIESRETTGTVVRDRKVDCGSTTVSKENAAGDRKTVTKEGC
ncbi:hypothetical protein [Methylobacterium iners]|uniref:Secreted protein n=1 Tax=Methylobacterium iners TaxID=418707 RepID=A0ABQ4S1P6_9HYPH|nr:hypothetical protein [Methylobacterium iners]GJD95778.1 hypothetical protein OCOJLMKI_2992 [Methylobacterium iners]